MTPEEAIVVAQSEWNAQGACASCGHHALLSEYGDLREAISINEAKGRLDLICLSGEGIDHRGVRIYFRRATPTVGPERRRIS